MGKKIVNKDLDGCILAFLPISSYSFLLGPMDPVEQFEGK